MKSGSEPHRQIANDFAMCSRGLAAPSHARPSAGKSSEQLSVSQVTALVAAAECASFSKAAKTVRMSQPAFSRHIKDAERALGSELFSRTHEGVCLTPIGATLLPQAKRMLEAYDDALVFLVARQVARRQILRVAASFAIGPVVQAALASQLQFKTSGTAPRLAVMSSEDVLKHVISQSAAFGLCGEMGGHPGIRYTPVLEAQMGLIVPFGCELPASVQSLDDFGKVPMVRLADSAPVTRLLRRDRVQFPAYFNSDMEFTCLSSAMDIMRRNRIAALGTGIGASLLCAREFRFVPLPGLLPTMVVHLISARLAESDDEMERVRNVVRSCVHQSPWHPSVRRLNQMYV